MNSSFILLAVLSAAALVSSSEAGVSTPTLARNHPPIRSSGTKQTDNSPSKQSVIAEKTIENLNDFLSKVEDGPSFEMEELPRNCARILPSSARAAAVAFVSAAAIGGARHALESLVCA